MSLVAPQGNRAPVPSLLGRQMAREGLALASVPVPSCGSWKASHLALPMPQKAEPLPEVVGSSQHWDYTDWEALASASSLEWIWVR